MGNKRVNKKHGRYIVRSYSVVEFIDEFIEERLFECIPDSWFVDDTKTSCYFPPRTGKGFSLRALNCDKPEDDWYECECIVISEGHLTYSYGFNVVKEKCSQKYNTSSAEDHIEEFNYRRQHPALVIQGERNFERVFSEPTLTMVKPSKENDNLRKQSKKKSAETVSILNITSPMVKPSKENENLRKQPKKKSAETVSILNGTSPMVKPPKENENLRKQSKKKSAETVEILNANHCIIGNLPSDYDKIGSQCSEKNHSPQSKKSHPRSDHLRQHSNQTNAAHQLRPDFTKEHNPQQTTTERPPRKSLSSSSGIKVSSSHSGEPVLHSNSNTRRSTSRNSRSKSSIRRSESSTRRSKSSTRLSKSSTRRSKPSIRRSESSTRRSKSSTRRSKSSIRRSVSSDQRSKYRSRRSNSIYQRSKSSDRHSKSFSRGLSLRRSVSRSNSIARRSLSVSRSNSSTQRSSIRRSRSNIRRSISNIRRSISSIRRSRYVRHSNSIDRHSRSNNRRLHSNERRSSSSDLQILQQSSTRRSLFRQSLHAVTDTQPTKHPSYTMQELVSEVKQLNKRNYDRSQTDNDRRLSRMEVTINKSFILLGDITNTNSLRVPDNVARSRRIDTESEDPEFEPPKLPISYSDELKNLHRELKNNRFRNFLTIIKSLDDKVTQTRR